MFRRIVNWLGWATTPEAAVVRPMPGGPVGIDENGSYLFHDGKAAMEFALRECFRTGEMVFAEVVPEPLVELTATETKAEHYARLSREIACECVRHNGGTERSSKLLAALNVMKLKMTLDDVSRAATSLRQPPN